MDGLDLAILREAGRGNHTGWGRRDPRISTNDIARGLGVPRSTVGARIRAWRECGFLVGYEIMPNPALLTARLCGVFFQVADPRARDRIPADLALLEGMLACIEHVDGWFMTAFAASTDEARDRVAALIGRIAGVSWSAPGMTCALPPCTIDMKHKDWLLLEALRRDPLQSLKGVAEMLGVNERSVRRRYTTLLESNALWFLPALDYSKWTGGAIVHFAAMLSPDVDVAHVADQVSSLLPEHLRVNETDAASIEAQEPMLEYYVHMEDPARAEYLNRQIAAVPGVVESKLLFPIRCRSFPYWIDEQLKLLTGNAQPTRGSVMPMASQTPRRAKGELGSRRRMVPGRPRPGQPPPG